MLMLSLSALNYLSFVISVLFIFRKSKNHVAAKYRLLQFCSVLFWGSSLYLMAGIGAKSSALTVSMVIVQLFCLFSFWLNYKLVMRHDLTIVFSTNIPQSLLSTGYYRWVRHPYYAIYLLCYLSVCIFTNHPVTWGFFAALCILYSNAAQFEEKKFEVSPLSEEYLAYKERTGAFFPKFF